MRWLHCPAHVSGHCRSWLSRLRQGNTSAAKQVQSKFDAFLLTEETQGSCAFVLLRQHRPDLCHVVLPYYSTIVHTWSRQFKYHHWVMLLSLKYIQTFWPCLYSTTAWKDPEDYKGKLGSYKQTSILCIISFDPADVAVIHWTVSIFNLGLFGGVKWPPLNTSCSSKSPSERLVLTLHVVSPADLCCENCKEGWDVCGLDRITEWLISYTLEGD